MSSDLELGTARYIRLAGSSESIAQPLAASDTVSSIKRPHVGAHWIWKHRYALLTWLLFTAGFILLMTLWVVPGIRAQKNVSCDMVTCGDRNMWGSLSWI